MNYGVKGTRTSILQIQQEPLPGGPIGAGGGRDQLAPTPYQLPRLARPEGCCDMSCDCLSKYHGRASRDALRVWSGWASTVIHGPRYEPDYGPRYEPDYGPRYAPGRRAALRAGPRAALHAGPTTAPPCRWTFGPTDGRRRYIPMDIEDPRPWSLQPDSCTVRWDYARGSDSAMLESTTHRWTGQLGPRHPPAPARTCSHSWLGTRAGARGATWANPGWNWWKAETTAGRARTGRALDVGVMGK